MVHYRHSGFVALLGSYFLSTRLFGIERLISIENFISLIDRTLLYKRYYDTNCEFWHKV
jgi:hypothetical protein